MRTIAVAIFLLFACSLFAQNVTIKGAAPYYAGKPVSLYIYDDLITRREIKQHTDTIDASGNFMLAMNTDRIQRSMLRIGNNKAHLYAAPGGSYDVSFPAPDTSEYQNPNVEHLHNLNWRFRDTLDLNALIIQYNMLFEDFYTERYAQFVTARASSAIDTFRLQCEKRYKNLDNPYFKSFIDYNLATLKVSFGRNEKLIYYVYLAKRPVQHSHAEYMELFNTAYKKYFQKLMLSQRGNKLIDAINGQASYTALNEVLRSDSTLRNDTLRELVMLKGLHDAYNDAAFSKENIHLIVETIESKSTIAEHRKIAGNMMRMHSTFAVGSKAPVFELPDRSGKKVSLSDFAGKHVYIAFYTKNSTASLQELKTMIDLQKEFGDKIALISISLDDSMQEMQSFLANSPKLNWTFLYGGDNEKLKEDYRIKGSPVFFLINTFGKIAQYPAKSPSQGIEDNFRKITGKKEKPVKVGSK